jgi:hypothetical protein
MHRRPPGEIQSGTELRWESIKVYSKKIHGFPETHIKRLNAAAWADDLKTIRRATLTRFGFKGWEVERNHVHQKIAGLPGVNAIELVGSYLDPEGEEFAFVEWHVLSPGSYQQIIWSTPGSYFFDSKVPAVRLLFESMVQDLSRTGGK